MVVTNTVIYLVTQRSLFLIETYKYSQGLGLDLTIIIGACHYDIRGEGVLIHDVLQLH